MEKLKNLKIGENLETKRKLADSIKLLNDSGYKGHRFQFVNDHGHMLTLDCGQGINGCLVTRLPNVKRLGQ